MSEHPIQLTPQMFINDYFFISTEDDSIRDLFIKEFDNKLKFFIYKKIIDYDYKN